MRTHFKFSVVLLGLVALPFMATSAASGLEQFKTGDPAKAELINKNFKYLDSGKVEKSAFDLMSAAVSAKLNKSVFDSVISGKANKTEISSLANQKGVDPVCVSDTSTNSWYCISGNGFSFSGPSDGRMSLSKGTLKYLAPPWNSNGDHSLNFEKPGAFLFSIDNSKGAGAPEDILSINSTATTTGQGIHVSGNITLTGTIVTPTKNLPDFVFSPTYKLQPLSETKAFITQNGHLPNIPSAKEVEKSGMDLVQMNQILLQKVEELTLHAIAQQEQIEALKARIPAP
ncbi:MAG TPA: hypothetical protein PKO15_17745 [Fibrobacteria bacterium]|nr:hypothetical protein [Fibrobacteria bacterium]